MTPQFRLPLLQLSRLVLLASCLSLAAQVTVSHAASAKVKRAELTGAVTRHRVIALTFDDGPSRYTYQVLSILRQYRAHATFFVVGIHIPTYPGALRATVANGNEIGNHTFHHANLQILNDATALWELRATQQLVHSVARVTPGWFRPPYMAIDGRVTSLAASVGLRTITWNDDPADWSMPGVNVIAARVIAQAHPGSVVIMHDGGGYRGETVAALPLILSQLHARGYKFVTLSQLFFPKRQTERSARCGRKRCHISRASKHKRREPVEVGTRLGGP